MSHLTNASRHVTVRVRYGKGIIRKLFAADTAVELQAKMLRPVHVPCIGENLAEHGITKLNLAANQV